MHKFIYSCELSWVHQYLPLFYGPYCLGHVSKMVECLVQVALLIATCQPKTQETQRQHKRVPSSIGFRILGADEFSFFFWVSPGHV